MLPNPFNSEVNMALSHWQKASSNIAFPQGGDDLVIGVPAGSAAKYNWRDLRYVLGSNSPDYITYFDDFLGVTAAAPSPLSTDVGSTGTATSASSALALLTAATNDDWTTVALGTHWTVGNGLTVFETRVKLSAITLAAFEVGLSDALDETAGLAFSDHSVAGVADVATNAVVVAFDTDGSSNLVLNCSNAGTPSAVDLGVAPVADTYVKIRLEINEDGDVNVYINDTLEATATSAIATTATVGPWLTCVARSGAARTLSVDYVATTGLR